MNRVRHACLVRMVSPKSKRTQLIDKEEFTFGRSTEAEVISSSLGVSRVHAQARIQDGTLWIEDRGSSNGTLVDGKRVPSKSTFELKVGSQMRLGDSDEIFTAEVFEMPVDGGVSPNERADANQVKLEAFEVGERMKEKARETAAAIEATARLEAAAILQAARAEAAALAKVESKPSEDEDDLPPIPHFSAQIPAHVPALVTIEKPPMPRAVAAHVAPNSEQTNTALRVLPDVAATGGAIKMREVSGEIDGADATGPSLARRLKKHAWALIAVPTVGLVLAGVAYLVVAKLHRTAAPSASMVSDAPPTAPDPRRPAAASDKP